MDNVLEVSTAVVLEIAHINKILHFEIRVTKTKLLLIASALKQCADDLKKEYDSLATVPQDPHTPVPERTWDLSCPTPVFGPDEAHFELAFNCRLDRENVGVTPVQWSKTDAIYHARSLFLADLRRDQPPLLRLWSSLLPRTTDVRTR
jgi:hypothetical protein